MCNQLSQAFQLLKRGWTSVFSCKIGLVLKTGLHFFFKHPLAQGKQTYRTKTCVLPVCNHCVTFFSSSNSMPWGLHIVYWVDEWKDEGLSHPCSQISSSALWVRDFVLEAVPSFNKRPRVHGLQISPSEVESQCIKDKTSFCGWMGGVAAPPGIPLVPWWTPCVASSESWCSIWKPWMH